MQTETASLVHSLAECHDRIALIQSTIDALLEARSIDHLTTYRLRVQKDTLAMMNSLAGEISEQIVEERVASLQR